MIGLAPSGISICKHHVDLTRAESVELDRVLKAQGHKGEYTSCCVRPSANTATIVARYFRDDPPSCSSCEAGEFREPTGMPCRLCDRGTIVVARVGCPGQTRIVFRCSRYPNCLHNPTRLTLSIPCKSCGTPLQLASGELMVCQCPRCHRRATVPVTLRAWPQLAIGLWPHGPCPHGSRPDVCPVCEESLREGRHLIELELSRIASGLLDVRPSTGQGNQSGSPGRPAPPKSNRAKKTRRRRRKRAPYANRVVVSKVQRCPHGVAKPEICAICDPKKFRFWHGYD